MAEAMRGVDARLRALTVALDDIDQALRTAQQRVARIAPEDTELRADVQAFHIQRIYTGIEDLLARALALIDGTGPRGEGWHAALLHQAAVATEDRPALLPRPVMDRLRGVMQFRHFSRHNYVMSLRPDDVERNWGELQQAVQEVRASLVDFVRSLTASSAAEAGAAAAKDEPPR